MATADLGVPIVDPHETATSLTERICGITFDERAGRGWWLGFLCSLALVGLLVVALVYLFAVGVGIWGIQIPVAWGFAIINYVWWIAVASGGTLISAIFFLTRSEWRSGIVRIAETMMLMAALCAGIFPIIHLGRPWYFYWLIPYPSMLGIYPQFRSPLLWDFFALLTYVFASVLFWYVSLVPDLATMRDRAPTPGWRLFYGTLALGWRGSAEHWRHHKTATLLFAGLLTPVVVSIHSVVGLDFAGGLTPGWHSTQFPHFFVFGAMLSGFATVMALVIPIRSVYRLQGLITFRHLDVLGKLLVASSLAVGYAYLMEVFLPLYGTDPYEKETVMLRLVGTNAPVFWATVSCNVVIPQLFWFPAVRRTPLLAFCICLVIITGMWLERYVIVVTSLARDFMPSAWQDFVPTFWDWATLAGTIGLFIAGIFVFVRLLPVVSMAEMRELIRSKENGS